MEPTDGSEIERAVGALENLVAAGAKVPLIDQVRIPEAGLREAVEGLHQTVRFEGAGFDRELAGAIDELDQVVAEARAIPLTRDVRLDRRRIEAALELTRARASALPEGRQGG